MKINKIFFIVISLFILSYTNIYADFLPYRMRLPFYWNDQIFTKDENQVLAGGQGWQKLGYYIKLAIKGQIVDLKANENCRLETIKLENPCNPIYCYRGGTKKTEKNGYYCNLTYKSASEYYGRVSSITDYVEVEIEGKHNKFVTNCNGHKNDRNCYNIPPSTPAMAELGSPFIYFKNAPNGNISINIDSKYNYYDSQNFGFNNGNGWTLNSNDGKISIDKSETEYLFYELAFDHVTLNRYGQNFSSQEQLVDFLNNSDFFSNLGFNDLEKENSLNYILPKIKESKNYYLTILEDNAVKSFSNLNIFPSPKNLKRVYFAIYPTNAPVKTNGDFKYPVLLENNNEYSVLETGELYIDKNVVVLWK